MHQVAQAFAWAAPRLLKPDGECGLLVPAMGLFEEPSAAFRRAFFQHFQVHGVANFSNLAEVLFDGRARVPTAALFYRLRPEDQTPSPDEPITTFSPFVVNQEATRPLADGERSKIWSLTINGSEIRTLTLAEVASGSGLPWKLAMWGTPWDERLIKRLEKKWPSLVKLQDDGDLLVAQGPDLYVTPQKKSSVDEETDAKDSAEELADEAKGYKQFKKYLGQPVLLPEKLKRFRCVFSFPTAALGSNKGSWLRLQGGSVGLRVFEPPHILTEEQPTKRWMNLYSVHDQRPLHGAKNPVTRDIRRGKYRPRLDIKFVSKGRLPNPRFCVEAKRLYRSDSVSSYMDDEGLGAFVGSYYAKSDSVGGMLGYVQTDSIAHWKIKIEAKLAVEASSLPLPNGAKSNPHSFKAGPKHTFKSRHQRAESSEPIDIFHTLLAFC